MTKPAGQRPNSRVKNDTNKLTEQTLAGCGSGPSLEGTAPPKKAESAVPAFLRHWQRSLSSLRSSSSWNRTRWPDGRLVHPGADRLYSIVGPVTLLLAGVEFWLVGRIELADVRIDAGTEMAMLAFLAAAAATCEAVSARRIRALADDATGGTRVAVRRIAAHICRAPRWPDGRLISRGEDKVALATHVAAVLLALVFSLVCGWVGVPNIDVGADLFLLPELLVGAICLALYWMSRRLIVIASNAEAVN